MSRETLGIPRGSVDAETAQIRFLVDVKDEPPMEFFGSYGSVAQMASALGRLLQQLRHRLGAARGLQPVAAEDIAAMHVQKDPWLNAVILHLVTPRGTPYIFRTSKGKSSRNC
jgi:hypothetical protein